MWEIEIIPEQWEDGLICCIHENIDHLELNMGYKIFYKILC